MAIVIKNPSANVGDMRDASSIPGLGRLPGGGHGNLLQYSCLENPMDRGAWQTTVHGVARSQTQLKLLSTYAQNGSNILWKTYTHLAKAHFKQRHEAGKAPGLSID